MKLLVLCICVLGFATSNLVDSEVKRQFKNAVSTIDNNFEVCMTENNITLDDWYEEEEIMTGIHAESENEERTKNLGCTIVCVLKKENLMEGSNIKERKIHARIDREIDSYGEKIIIHKIARDCMKKVRNITEECEKGFALFACAVKAAHKLQEHEEHERVITDENEEHEKVKTNENEEAEQTV